MNENKYILNQKDVETLHRCGFKLTKETQDDGFTEDSKIYRAVIEKLSPYTNTRFSGGIWYSDTEEFFQAVIRTANEIDVDEYIMASIGEGKTKEVSIEDLLLEIRWWKKELLYLGAKLGERKQLFEIHFSVFTDEGVLRDSIGDISSKIADLFNLARIPLEEKDVYVDNATAYQFVNKEDANE